MASRRFGAKQSILPILSGLGSGLTSEEQDADTGAGIDRLLKAKGLWRSAARTLDILCILLWYAIPLKAADSRLCGIMGTIRSSSMD
jgi:hypothetical protein